MSKEKNDETYAFPNMPTPTMPVIFDPEICTGCNLCIEVCQMDLLIPNPEKGKSPLVLFPDECWYCACCVFHCPKSGAIRLNYPLMWRVPWKRSDTGKHYWIGMKNSLPPNPKPPV